MWVPIVEKAYAFFRKGKGTYPSIASGNGSLAEHLNIEKTGWAIDDGVDPAAVVAWHKNGAPAGFIASKVDKGVEVLLNWIDDELNEGMPVYTGAKSGIKDSTPIQLDDPDKAGNQSTWRRGQHIYMVDHVIFSGSTPTGLVLRDPYGKYRTITDPVRIYFCIGRAVIIDLL